MRISVVIPAHNEEADIAHSIRAALAQDYSDFEVIVVNNASEDGTEAVARSFPQIKLVNESRKGLAWAREAGRLAAGGDVIANMDADCLPDPTWLSKGVAHFDDRRVSAVSGPYDYYDGGAVFRYTSLYLQTSVYWLMAKALQLPFVKAGAVLIGGNNMLRAEMLHKAGGYNTSLTFYGEDTDTAVRMSKFGRVIFSNRLTMKTSARRFKAEGTVALGFKYVAHFFKTLLTERSKGQT